MSPSTDECMKMQCVHVCVCVCVTEYYSAIKKSKIVPFATIWMDQKNIMLTEMSYRERQILYEITNMRNLNNTTTSECDKKEAESQISRGTNQWLPVGRGKVGGASGKYKLLGIRQAYECTYNMGNTANICIQKIKMLKLYAYSL